jgi:hypothetical protein
MGVPHEDLKDREGYLLQTLFKSGGSGGRTEFGKTVGCGGGAIPTRTPGSPGGPRSPGSPVGPWNTKQFIITSPNS